MILQEQHCELCDHSRKDLVRGVFCGLANEKPQFVDTCADVEHGDALKQKIIEKETNHRYLNFEKSAVWRGVIQYAIIGAFFLIGGIVFLIKLWDYGYVATLPFAIIGIGMFLLPKAIAGWRHHNYLISKARQDLETLKKVLELYHVEYQIQMEVCTGRHDNEVKFQLTGKKRGRIFIQEKGARNFDH